MVKLISSSGAEINVGLDFTAMVDYEKASGKSIFQVVADFDTKPSLTDLDTLTSFFYPGGWKAFVKDGFTIEDFKQVLSKGFEELGFTSLGQD